MTILAWFILSLSILGFFSLFMIAVKYTADYTWKQSLIATVKTFGVIAFLFLVCLGISWALSVLTVTG